MSRPKSEFYKEQAHQAALRRDSGMAATLRQVARDFKVLEDRIAELEA